MTPDAILARQWSAMKRAGMLKAASVQPQLGLALAADVMFDAPGALVLDDVQTLEPSMRYRVSDLPALAAGDRVTIGTALFEVRDALPIDDGLLARASLRRMD